MKRLTVLATGLLAGMLGASCGLVAGVDFGAVQPEGTGGAASTSTSASAGGAESTSASTSTGAGGMDPGPPCDPNELLDEPHGMFVSVSTGDDVNGNGSEIAPLKTIAKGLQAASASTRKIVYLDEGTYAEKVVFTSAAAGILVRGGFARKGASWTRDCKASTQTLLQAPSAIAVEVSGTAVASGLSELTITTKAAGNSLPDIAGESVYGVHVSGDGTSFSLHAVTILAGDGGDGGVPSPGVTPPAAEGTCDNPAPACSDGALGMNGGSAKAAPSGAFALGGYLPGDGGVGVTGEPGHNGAPGPTNANSCTSCSGCGALHCNCACAQSGCNNYCDAGSQSAVQVTSPPGPCGCGGPGGTGGASGRGGGASVALFVAGNATVSVSYGSLTAGKGGSGSAGGAGALGASGSDGAKSGAQCATGSCTCSVNSGGGASCGTSGPTTLVTSAVGQNGGSGGMSSKGAGGAGAPSYAVVLVGGATLVDDHATFAPGTGGTGADGAPSGSMGPKLVLP